MKTDQPLPDDIKLEISAELRYLDTVAQVVETALSQSGDAQVVFAVKLAVHEICVNIIEHAYHGTPGTIQILFHANHLPPQIVVQLCDQGDAADVANFVEPNLEEPQVKGYGLYLVRNLVDYVDYTRIGGTNQWTLSKTLS